VAQTVDIGVKESDVAALFRDPRYIELEQQIAQAVSQRILFEYADHVLPPIAKELHDAQLSPPVVEGLLDADLSAVAAFGIALLRGEAEVPDEQEWDPEEGDQQEADSKGEPVGLAPGFALTYLIYVSFLRNDDEVALLKHLKARRIPHATRFLSRLKAYFREARAV
jgi:hypothetical protein